MGCRILYDHEQNLAALYCSTTDVTFGPVFYGKEYDADERAEAFLRWLQSPQCPWTTFEGHDVLPGRDARHLTDSGLQSAYSAWLAQEADQWTREEKESEVQS